MNTAVCLTTPPEKMTTVTEPNVHNIAVEGTFDDCQNIVKDLFGDEAFRQKVHPHGSNFKYDFQVVDSSTT